MNRREAYIWRSILPTVFWAVGMGGSLVPVFLLENGVHPNYLCGYLVSVLLLIPELMVSRIHRHESSEVACFWIGLTVGISSYWIPTVLFLILPFWISLIVKNVFTLRGLVATAIGVGMVAIYAALAIWLGWLTNTWADFFAVEHLWGWIPIGAVTLAWVLSIYIKRVFYVR